MSPKTEAKKYTIWPIAIIEDRYAGTYSDGLWIAFLDAYNNLDKINLGPHNDDVTARAFNYNQNWLAAGSTPQEALDKLKEKITTKC